MPLLRHKPTILLKFCSKETKTSNFGRYARSIPKHKLPRCFTKTVTEHHKSVYGCFPLLELNLDFWDGSQWFNDELLKRRVPRATKEFTESCIYKSIPTNLPFLSHNSHSPNYYSRVVQLTRIQTTRGLTSPPLFAILATHTLIQCVIVAQQSWMMKCFHRALEFSQNN